MANVAREDMLISASDGVEVFCGEGRTRAVGCIYRRHIVTARMREVSASTIRNLTWAQFDEYEENKERGVA